MNRTNVVIALLVTALLFILFAVLAPDTDRPEPPIVTRNVPIVNQAPQNISCLTGIEIGRDTVLSTLTVGVNGRPEKNVQGGPVVPRYPRVIVCTVFGE